jgi:hypothetical protein
MSNVLDDYESFPPGTWVVEVKGIEPMGFEGEDIIPTEFGLFLRHKAMNENFENRTSFIPWSSGLVKRAYTVRESQK